jgi:hypothetical protein
MPPLRLLEPRESHRPARCLEPVQTHDRTFGTPLRSADVDHVVGDVTTNI